MVNNKNVVFLLLALVLALSSPYLTGKIIDLNSIVSDTTAIITSISVLGTIFALISAFMIFGLWQRYKELNSSVEEEATALEDLYDLTKFISEIRDSDAIRQRIRAYRDISKRPEWESLTHDEMAGVGRDQVEELIMAINSIKPENKKNEIALDKMIDKIGDVTTFRARRLTLSNSRFPRSLYMIDFLMAVGLIVCVLLIPMGNQNLGYMLKGFVASAIILILYVIADMDDVFVGGWSVKPDVYDLVAID